MLTTPVEELGYKFYSIPGLQLAYALGRGSSCVAYFSKYDEKECVAKIFKKKERFENEKKIIQLVSKKCLPHVPTYVTDFFTNNEYMLVVTPVGQPVVPSQNGERTVGSDLANIVSVLRNAHSLGICHRDVKPDNIFIIDTDTRYVILNDWGSACLTEEKVLWQGTIGFADPCSEDPSEYVPSFAADLRALIRSAYVMWFNEFPPSDPKEVENFWAARFSFGTLWVKAIQAADELDYTLLQVIFMQLK